MVIVSTFVAETTTGANAGATRGVKSNSVHLSPWLHELQSSPSLTLHKSYDTIFANNVGMTEYLVRLRNFTFWLTKIQASLSLHERPLMLLISITPGLKLQNPIRQLIDRLLVFASDYHSVCPLPILSNLGTSKQNDPGLAKLLFKLLLKLVSR